MGSPPSISTSEPQNVALKPKPEPEVAVEKVIGPPDQAEEEYPKGMKVLVIMLAVWLSMFIVALVCLNSHLLHLLPAPSLLLLLSVPTR